MPFQVAKVQMLACDSLLTAAAKDSGARAMWTRFKFRPESDGDSKPAWFIAVQQGGKRGFIISSPKKRGSIEDVNQ